MHGSDRRGALARACVRARKGRCFDPWSMCPALHCRGRRARPCRASTAALADVEAISGTERRRSRTFPARSRRRIPAYKAGRGTGPRPLHEIRHTVPLCHHRGPSGYGEPAGAVACVRERRQRGRANQVSICSWHNGDHPSVSWQIQLVGNIPILKLRLVCARLWLQHKQNQIADKPPDLPHNGAA
jgi:hypothetical protein